MMLKPLNFLKAMSFPALLIAGMGLSMPSFSGSLGEMRFLEDSDSGASSTNSAAASAVVAAVPEVKATEKILPVILRALRKRPSFQMKLSFDSAHPNLGPLKDGQAHLIVPFKEDILVPMDPKKPEAGDFAFLSAGLALVGDIALNKTGNFEGKIIFQKDGQKAELESTIQYMSLPGIQFKISEIEFLGAGADTKTPVLKITGNCVLKQLVLDSVVRSGEFYSDKWIDAKCVYEFTYDKSKDLYRFKFDYDSLTTGSSAGVP